MKVSLTSLRSRLVVLLGALAAAVSIVATATSYAATDHQLSTQLDGALFGAANQLVSAPGSLQPVGSLPPGVPPGGLAPTAKRPPALFNLVVAEELRPNGTVAARLSAVTLPVDALDRALACSGGEPSMRTITVSGVSYRMVTEPLRGGGAVQVAQSLAPIDGVLGALRWRFIMLDAGLIILAGFIGWLVARRFTNPLERLTATAESIAASGSLVAWVDTSGRDEVGRLGRAFSAMLAALATSKFQQQRLVRDAGHELRTPLTSLRSNIDLLRRHGTDLPEEARERLLRDLDSELRELSMLMDEVVELATDSRATEPTVDVAVDILVRRAGSRLQARFGRVVSTVSEPFSLEVRPRSLERIVTNLLENAAKFSPSTEPIEIVVRNGMISVRDHGPGFVPEDLPYVFDRFYRGENARSLPGSGLGLSIVRELAEELGGRVVAQNAPDGGALLTITFPESRSS